MKTTPNSRRSRLLHTRFTLVVQLYLYNGFGGCLVDFDCLFVCLILIIFLLLVIGSTCFDAKKIVPMFPAYYIFNSLLLLLLVLHVIWTYFILKVLYRAIQSGKVSDSGIIRFFVPRSKCCFCISLMLFLVIS